MFKKHQYLLVVFFAIILSGILHSPHFSKDLISMHTWRQTQTQSTTISFYEEDLNIFNPRKNNREDGEGIFRMEFPIMQWTNALLFYVFGNHILVTRLYMFLISMLSILGMYFFLKHLLKKEMLASIGAWAFTFSPSFYYHSINPMPDNLALCFSLWGLVFFAKWMNKPKQYFLIISGVLLAFGALTKLPFIIYFIFPFIYLLVTHKIFTKGTLLKSFYVFIWAVLPLAWYAYVIPSWGGNRVVNNLFTGDNFWSKYFSSMKDNLTSTLPELLINYAALPLFLAGLYYALKNKSYQNKKFWPLAILLLSLICFVLLELNAIKNDHDYYLFPFYPLIFMIVGYGGYYLVTQQKQIKYFALILLIATPISCFLRNSGRWNENSPGFNKDLLVYKDALQEATPQNDLVVVGNDTSPFIMFYYLHKKGWKFHDDELSADKLKKYINKGAKYLYSDSKKVNSNPAIQSLIEKKITQKGSITVYQLK